jgi:hypothetical protein
MLWIWEEVQMIISIVVGLFIEKFYWRLFWIYIPDSMLGGSKWKFEVFLVTWMWSFDNASKFHFGDNNSPKTFHGHITLSLVNPSFRGQPRRRLCRLLVLEDVSSLPTLFFSVHGLRQPSIAGRSSTSEIRLLNNTWRSCLQPKAGPAAQVQGKAWYLFEVNKQWTGRDWPDEPVELEKITGWSSRLQGIYHHCRGIYGIQPGFIKKNHKR